MTFMDFPWISLWTSLDYGFVERLHGARMFAAVAVWPAVTSKNSLLGWEPRTQQSPWSRAEQQRMHRKLRWKHPSKFLRGQLACTDLSRHVSLRNIDKALLPIFFGNAMNPLSESLSENLSQSHFERIWKALSIPFSFWQPRNHGNPRWSSTGWLAFQLRTTLSSTRRDKMSRWNRTAFHIFHNDHSVHKLKMWCPWCLFCTAPRWTICDPIRGDKNGVEAGQTQKGLISCFRCFSLQFICLWMFVELQLPPQSKQLQNNWIVLDGSWSFRDLKMPWPVDCALRRCRLLLSRCLWTLRILGSFTSWCPGGGWWKGMLRSKAHYCTDW